MADKKPAAKKEEEPKVPEATDPFLETAGRTIDERMKDLLKDHKKMGVR